MILCLENILTEETLITIDRELETSVFIEARKTAPMERSFRQK